MKLKSLNNLDPKFGFPNEMGYENENFHGHQIGVAVCIENMDGSIFKNMLKEGTKNADDVLKELLSSGAKFIEEDITQMDDENNLHRRKIVYLPYAAIESSCFQPTINFDCVDDAVNTHHHVKIEVLFVADQLNRYVIVETDTQNVSMLELVNDTFNDDESLEELGFKHLTDCDDGEGWYLDMYNEAGAKFDVNLGLTGDQILTNVNSVRLISIETFMEENRKEEQKDEEITVYKE